MPVAIDHPTAGERFTQFDVYRDEPLITRVSVQLQCHYCGFGPMEASDAGCRCPKCKGHSWDRLVRRLHIDGFEARRAARPRMSLGGGTDARPGSLDRWVTRNS